MFSTKQSTFPYDAELQEIFCKNEFYKARSVSSLYSIEKLCTIIFDIAFLFLAAVLCAIISIAFSVIIHNPHDKTQITLAITFVFFFGGAILFTCLYFARKIIVPIDKDKKLTALSKTCLITYGKILAVNKHEYGILSKSCRGIGTRIIVNYRFINTSGQFVNGTFYGNFDSSPSFRIGDSIPILFNAIFSTLIESFVNDSDNIADIDNNKTLT